MKEDDLLKTGERLVARARALGADEATARLSRSDSSSLEQRDGHLESFRESRSLSASVALLVDGRYSVHGTNDLRPEAVDPFLERAVAATRFLEPDPDRGLALLADMGAADALRLDQVDPGWGELQPSGRRVAVQALETRCRELGASLPVRSVTAHAWDGRVERAMVTSNGFSAAWESTSFGSGATVSLEEPGGRVPEAWSFRQVRHAADLPGDDELAADALDRARRRLDSGAAPSGRYPLLIEARNVGRLLGMLLSPLSGEAVFERRSCMAGRLGKTVAAQGFHLFDDPLVPRGLGSHPHDPDGLPGRARPIIEGGVLRCFLLDVYDGRRLHVPPTTGGTSNVVMPVGTRSPDQIAAELPRCIRVEGFLGGNSNSTTGDFSFGINGTLLERGQPARALSEMNVSGNLFELLERWLEAADDPWTFGSWRCATLLFDDVQFSGS